jgi:hypothetical protein
MGSIMKNGDLVDAQLPRRHHLKEGSMPKTRRIRFFIAALFVLLSSTSAYAALSRATTGSYVDVLSYLQSDAQVDAWDNMTWGLNRNFNDFCSDTYCEGDFSIESLRYRCSVHHPTGKIGMCVWVFAAVSNELISPTTGEISIQQRSWQCRTPLPPDTRIEELLTALAGNNPGHATLPGSNGSILNTLIDCL